MWSLARVRLRVVTGEEVLSCASTQATSYSNGLPLSFSTPSRSRGSFEPEQTPPLAKNWQETQKIPYNFLFRYGTKYVASYPQKEKFGTIYRIVWLCMKFFHERRQI
jgi:hypothetical protein